MIRGPHAAFLLAHHTEAANPEMHPETAASLGMRSGERVTLATPAGSTRVRAKITERAQRGVVAAQTGWWEACEELGLPGQDPFSEQGANVCLIITNAALDPISGSIPGKAYPCNLVKVDCTP